MKPDSALPPTVSIGVPVFNGERYLEGALRSLSAQTYTDFEVVISDNGSTDSTEEICRRFVESDSRFRYVRQPENRGAAWNFNEVVRLAAGRYFKWATHDDLLAETFLEVCVDMLDTAPASVGLCYPQSVLIDGDGEHIRDFEDNLDFRDPHPPDRFRRYLRNYVLSNPIFGLHRTDMLRQTRLLGVYVSSDLVLFSEIVLLGEIWEIPERLFFRRWHAAMSRQANVKNKDVMAWFDPNRKADRVMPRSRLLIENVRAIFHVPLSVVDRVRSLVILAQAWLPRYWRSYAGELRHESLRLVRLRK